MAKDKTKIKLGSEKIRSRQKSIKILKLGLLISLIFLISVYFVLRVIYEQGAFTVSLDPNFSKSSGIVIYENLEIKQSKRILAADKMETMDNISINWLPDNLNNEADGAHNGDNYIAYTFYIENQGIETIHYWYQIVIDDVMRDVDKAIRVMIYHNGSSEVYAKSKSNGEAESGTVPFYSDEYVLLKQRRDFNDGDIDKITIVIWIEGDDPDCIDALIGGQMKMHMEIIEESAQ